MRRFPFTAAAALLIAGAASADSDWQLTGRYHGQYYWVDGGAAGSDNGWEQRRTRIGAEGTIVEGLRFVGDVDLDTGNDTPFVDKLNTGYLEWRPAPGWTVAAGKLRRNPLTREDGIGTNVLVTVERALLTSVYFYRNHGGIAVTRKSGPWTVSGAVLSPREERDFALPTLGGGIAFVGNVARRFGDSEVRVDWLHSEADDDANTVAPYRDVVSVNGRFVRGRLELLGDLIGARSRRDGPGDVAGVVASAEWRATPRLQLVARGEVALADRDNGLRLPPRYARRIVVAGNQRGDDYRAIYTGLRYALRPVRAGQPRLHALLGVERSRLERPDGPVDADTLFAAIRGYF